MIKLSKIIQDHAESLVDEVGKKGDTLYVPNLNNIEFLEYAKMRKRPEILVRNAKIWFNDYARVMRNTFTGNIHEKSKLTLYWRIFPEIKIAPVGNKRYSVYFRVYIAPKG